MSQDKVICKSTDWDFNTLNEYDKEIQRIAEEYLKLDYYPNQIEIVSSEQMIDAYSLIGLPTSYPHWKFGKEFMQTSVNYIKGRQGLAYELVINSNPCISYNMEDNTQCLMALVLAHAAYGHNSFFKCNYMFKQWTDADNIIDEMVYAREFILKCEDKYGMEEVENVLDAAHTLQRYGVDKMKRPKKKTKKELEERRKMLIQYEEENYNVLWETLPTSIKEKMFGKDYNTKTFKPEDNILYFIEQNAPNLPLWKREIIRIVRYIGQYFYPQSQTKVVNEGWASFCHYHILHKMYDEGLVNEGFMLEFIKSHSGVLYQPPYNSQYFSGLNPYTLGFNIFQDIKRMCEDPTDEDREWFPNIAGGDWLEQVTYAMENFRDDSFILQYLSPKVIRDMELFLTLDIEDDEEYYHVNAIHNKQGYKAIREALYRQYQRGNFLPNIKVTGFDKYGDNKMTLTHFIQDGKLLDEDEAYDVLLEIQTLWGHPIDLVGHFESGDEIVYLEV